MQPQTLFAIVLLVGAFYLLILRPARTRQKAQQETMNSLAVGKKVMTTGGLFGTVTEVIDDRIELEIADGVRVQYLQAAVARVVPDPEPEATDEPEEPESDSDEDDADQVDVPDAAEADHAGRTPSEAVIKDATGGDTQAR